MVSTDVDDHGGYPHTLEIPDISTAAAGGTLAAALEYAQHGWYILPVNPHTKHPGSVVGKGWPALSSRDPKTITAWFAGTNHGIALHVGRSGAIVCDVDHYDNVPDDVLAATETTSCPYQSTRPDQPGRGHYLFANTTGRRIGNGLGALATTPGWGEIRGANGVIIAEPSEHPDGGKYHWERIGPLPPLPDYLADMLPESSTPESCATDAEVEHFLNQHTAGTNLNAITGLKNALTTKLANGHSCHMSTLGVLTDAMSEAAAGYYPARTAVRELWTIYRTTATTGTSTGRHLTGREAKTEYKGIVAWAVGQAETNTSQARQRLADRYRQPVIEVQPDDIHPPDTSDIGELETLENGFWESRDTLTLIYTAALSHMCSPWAVLACCTARILTLVPPTVTLPPIIGGQGSLNWFAAIVAKSGGGKGAASAVAATLIPADLTIHGVGSGEGMIEAFNRDAPPQDHNTAILFSVDEIDSLTSLRARAGQTTMSVLRSGFSGEPLGYTYRGRAHETVDAHTYRMTMIAAVQPERAEGLFTDAGGGTPQRFMWFPGRDKRITCNRPHWPTDNDGFNQTIPPPAYKQFAHQPVDIPDEAAALICQARAESMAGNDNALDGHALFCREKFAYALALLDGRTDMNIEDWRLSGIAAAVSDWCRNRAQKTLETAQHTMAKERGHLRGVEHYEADISKAVSQREDLHRLLRWTIEKIQEAGGRIRNRDLANKASSRDRARLREALAAGVEAGLLERDDNEWVLAVKQRNRGVGHSVGHVLPLSKTEQAF